MLYYIKSKNNPGGWFFFVSQKPVYAACDVAPGNHWNWRVKNIYHRYDGPDRFITDCNELKMANHSEVYLSREGYDDITVDLSGQAGRFEELKPVISLVAENICMLDDTVQRFHQLYRKEEDFPYDLAVIQLDEPAGSVVLEYWGTSVNTQFDVVFEYRDHGFTLKRFGGIHDISPDWDKAPGT